MKKLVAILFLFVFLFADTAFGQLLKLPALIHHYHFHHSHQHSGDDHGPSFWQFLNQHYNSFDVKPGVPGHDHRSLPFKSANCHAINSIAAIPQLNYFALPLLALTSNNANIARDTHPYASTTHEGIWQPPRLG